MRVYLDDFDAAVSYYHNAVNKVGTAAHDVDCLINLFPSHAEKLIEISARMLSLESQARNVERELVVIYTVIQASS